MSQTEPRQTPIGPPLHEASQFPKTLLLLARIREREREVVAGFPVIRVLLGSGLESGCCRREVPPVQKNQPDLAMHESKFRVQARRASKLAKGFDLFARISQFDRRGK